MKTGGVEHNRSEQHRRSNRESKIWKVRAVKPYPEAHNHLLIGQVVRQDAVVLEMYCRTFHFGSRVDGRNRVRCGPLEERLIPWSRIEIINLLPTAFDYRHAKLVVRDDEIFLTDGHEMRTIVNNADRRSY